MESRARPRAHHTGYRRGRLARLCLRGDRERRPARGAPGPGRTRCDDRTDRGYPARLITRARGGGGTVTRSTSYVSFSRAVLATGAGRIIEADHAQGDAEQVVVPVPVSHKVLSAAGARIHLLRWLTLPLDLAVRPCGLLGSTTREQCHHHQPLSHHLRLSRPPRKGQGWLGQHGARPAPA